MCIRDSPGRPRPSFCCCPLRCETKTPAASRGNAASKAPTVYACAPVSYTHLDGYKRQQPSSAGGGRFSGNHGRRSPANGTAILKIHRLTAGSYTHLDVYKRQVLSPDCNTAALSKGAYRRKNLKNDPETVHQNSPVSYTHLDVYKRQGHWPVSGPRDCNAAGRLYQSGFGAGQGFGIF